MSKTIFHLVFVATVISLFSGCVKSDTITEQQKAAQVSKKLNNFVEIPLVAPKPAALPVSTQVKR